MLPAPQRRVVDHRTIKLLVGWFSFGILVVPAAMSYPTYLKSISEAYWQGWWARGTFVGFHFAIAALMLAYNGNSRTQMVWSKVAAMSAMTVALFPCTCDIHVFELPWWAHYAAATADFVLFAYFCWTFRDRAARKDWPQARRREWIYMVCLVAILLSILAGLVNAATHDSFTKHFQYFVFWDEAVGLFAASVSWLVASRSLPLAPITHPDEEFSPFGEHVDEDPELEVKIGSPLCGKVR